jgi:hypothetical protein
MRLGEVGVGQVLVIDSSARAVLSARANVWLRRLPVRVVRSDLFEAVTGEAFSPVMLARVGELEERGLIKPGQRYEDLVVIRADRSNDDQGLES